MKKIKYPTESLSYCRKERSWEYIILKTKKHANMCNHCIKCTFSTCVHIASKKMNTLRNTLFFLGYMEHSRTDGVCKDLHIAL